MADTYTQALKARKIEEFAYDDDWGPRLNEDVVDIFDAGISGQVEIDIGSNTTYTLAAMQNGTLSDSHYWRLNIVGTPAGAVTFTIPASVTPQKEYLIDNQTGQALTVKYAATAGVTLQDGDVVRVLCDGTTVIESPAGTQIRSGSFTGTLTGVSAGGTGTVSWRRTGSMVTLWVGSQLAGTSNTNAATMTGLPSEILPAANNRVVPCVLLNASTSEIGWVTLFSGSGTMNIARAAGPFDTFGTKGFPAGWCVTFSV